jgi:hypothetical protein
MRRFMMCIDNEILFGCSDQKGWVGGGCGCMEVRRDNAGIGVKPEVNKSLGRRWCKCKCKYKIELQVVVWE